MTMISMTIMILLMEEILHHLGCIKPCKQWDKLPINWFRISFVNSTMIMRTRVWVQYEYMFSTAFQAPTCAVMARASVQCGALGPSWNNAMHRRGTKDSPFLLVDLGAPPGNLVSTLK